MLKDGKAPPELEDAWAQHCHVNWFPRDQSQRERTVQVRVARPRKSLA